MSFKPSDLLRFLGAVIILAAVGGLLVARVARHEAPRRPEAQEAPRANPSASVPGPASAECAAPAWRTAAASNAASLRTLIWAPFRRTELGWETYAPLIGRQIGSTCAPDSEGFAAALAAWQAQRALPRDGRLTEAVFMRLSAEAQAGRLFQRNNGVCPPPAPEETLETGSPEDGYLGKIVQLRPEVFAAYRRMAAAARAEDPAVRADPRNLTIFSGFRSPAADAARCAADGGCDGIARAISCSPHRTGLALDLYVGAAPGLRPDSSADANRLAMSRQPAYRWLVTNGRRFGFVNYPFEPWHWEWVGDAG